MNTVALLPITWDPPRRTIVLLWQYYNTFMGRRIYRNSETGKFALEETLLGAKEAA